MITVVGGGLAGSLLSLELAARGRRVRLIDTAGESRATATALSYGLMPWNAARPWRRLQRQQGDLGLRQRWLLLGHQRVPIPAWQVDPCRFAAAIAPRLEALGVERLHQHLSQIPSDAVPLVLACGAGCRALAPELDARLRVSWAGILELDRAATRDWLGWRHGLAQLPERFARVALERRADAAEGDDWIVDAGLVPCGDRLLAGQITLIRPGLAAGEPPDPAEMEQRLRSALSERWPALADAAAEYRQAPVSFCRDGRPLIGPCGVGRWSFAGFSGAFGQVPDAARCLADQLAAN